MYALMGANGKITSKLARILLGRGHKVRVIGRAAGRMQGLRDGGADLAVGDIADTAFLASAFNGASAVYAMIPPDYASPDHRAWQNRAGAAIADALGSSGVKTVVSLSSAGAALPEGTGPIAGLHDQETRLRALPGVDVLHLRVGYFLENHLHAIGLIRAFGVYPGMIAPDAQIGMIATQDIAHHIANELVSPTFSGQVVRHLVGPRDVTMVEAARVLGTAAGRPGLAYVHSDPAQAKAGMVQAGFSQNVADLFEQMSNAMSDGRIAETLKNPVPVRATTTLEQFAGTFAAAFSAAH